MRSKDNGDGEFPADLSIRPDDSVAPTEYGFIGSVRAPEAEPTENYGHINQSVQSSDYAWLDQSGNSVKSLPAGASSGGADYGVLPSQDGPAQRVDSEYTTLPLN